MTTTDVILHDDARAPALDRGLAIIEWLAAAAEPVGFGQIVKAVNLNAATAVRLLETLIARQYVIKTRQGQYTLGPAASGLLAGPVLFDQLIQRGQAVLESLSKLTGNSAVLFGWTGRHAQCLAKVVHPDAPAMQNVGQLNERLHEIPWNCLALAHMTTAQQKRWATKTDTHPRQLKRALQAAATALEKDGYVLDDFQIISHVRRFGAPVYGSRNRFIGMLGLGGTLATMPDDQLTRLGQQVADHALTLSSIMGADVDALPWSS